MANASVNAVTFAMPAPMTIVPSSRDRLADVVHTPWTPLAPQALRRVRDPVYERARPSRLQGVHRRNCMVRVPPARLVHEIIACEPCGYSERIEQPISTMIKV
jgi:hypothetical protein